MSIMKGDKCLNPECDKFSHSRGLCAGCYRLARAMIIFNIKSWNQLKYEGKVTVSKVPWRQRWRAKDLKTAKWLLS